VKRNYWALLQAQPAAQLAEQVRQFEDLGLYGVWVPQLYSAPFPAMAAIAMVSTKLRIGSGIALAFTRSPVETALNSLDLDRISGGRIILGLGTGVRAWNENIHGAAYGQPIERLREVCTTVRTIIEQGHTGNLGALEGSYHKLDLKGFSTFQKPVHGTVPIWLSALFHNSVELAAQCGDGLLGHPMWSLQATAENASKSANALAAAGRQRAKFHLNLWAYAAIANDRKSAIDDMRGTVAFYASIAQYAKYYEAHGFGAAARSAAEAAARNDHRAMVAAIPDEMVTTFTIAGTPDDARERVGKMWEYADSLTLLPPQFGLSGERLATYRACIVDTFYKV
jgi:alkanesulfonate monooxygenase SsuD/methylene tetrahydromethanopterin reductase-like flavin-dependent oxidoreductase (luciferase family)